jgi:K+-sensing histidine kinase KdpD
MVLFRHRATENELEVAAARGFDHPSRLGRYSCSKGRTGRCATNATSDRVDDVSKHRAEFDDDLLSALEQALGAPVRSWMAIPIGDTTKTNRGVIKVVNSTSRGGWFTEQDQSAGEDLAHELQLIIDRFLSLKAAQVAQDISEQKTQEARRSLSAEKAAREEAERLAHRASEATAMAQAEARERQNDIMNVSHQLQGPLTSLLMGLSVTRSKLKAEWFQQELLYLREIAVDAQIMTYGTFITLAKDAGEEPILEPVGVDVVAEVHNLAERLQRTNGRQDLAYRYSNHPDFPTITIDRHILTSVNYSLIHNAMKYADTASTVTLECTFDESPLHEPVLRVGTYGPPIQPHESRLIFEKFKRGYHVSTTGRGHRGVGLGLWVAKRLIRSVGGDLIVRLEEDDPTLSTFVVFFPSSAIHQSRGTD